MTAGWAWLVLFAFAAGFDVYANLTHQATLSRWVWHMDGRWWWFRAAAMTFVIALVVHFFGERK